MIICVCNALTEKDIQKMSLEEYNEIVQCGVCRKYVEEIIENNTKKVLD